MVVAGNRLRVANELPLLMAATAVLIAIIYVVPVPWLRGPLGLLFVFFAPGYGMVALAAPRRGDLSGSERILISFVLSVMFVPLLMLPLAYTPWKLTPETITLSLCVLTIGSSVGAWWRRKLLSPEERFVLEVTLPRIGRKGGPIDRSLGVLLAVSVLAAIASFGYIVIAPKQVETFSELYLLGKWQTIDNYITRVRVGNTWESTVGVVNQEGRAASYQLELVRSGTSVDRLYLGLLQDGERVERAVKMQLPELGSQKLELLLYKDGANVPYRSNQVWVDVKSRDEPFTNLDVSVPRDELVAGQIATLKIELLNQEGSHQDYRIYYQLQWGLGPTQILREDPPVSLEDGESWSTELPVELEALEPGKLLSIRFWVYTEWGGEPVVTRTLFMNVIFKDPKIFLTTEEIKEGFKRSLEQK